MTCNCNRSGDVEYIITLNQQGPQGRQGNVGQSGFSPIITVQSNTEANYQLKIISEDGEIITPNLKGQDGTIPSGVAVINGNNTFRGLNGFVNTTEFSSTVILDNSNLLVEGGNITFTDEITTTDFPITYNGVNLSMGDPNATALTNLIMYGPIYATQGPLDNTTHRVALITELDELADDVVDINSQLAGLSFKKYTEEEYASITTPDTNTLYMVTNSDGNTFKLYLGSIELEGGGGGAVLSGDNASQKTYVTNVDATVSATKVE